MYFQLRESWDQADVIFATISGSVLLAFVLSFIHTCRRESNQFWHHAVRLPSEMNQPYWYLIAFSTGCQPWAGHEGEVFVKLVGTRGEGKTIVANGSVHSRLWEADSHLCLYSSTRSLGDIMYVMVTCLPAMRQKRWFLANVHIKFVTTDPDKEKTWYFPYHEWIRVLGDPVQVTLCGVDAEHDLTRRLFLEWLSRSFTDFHLLLSIFGPLKYTRFRRNERILCLAVQVHSSMLLCGMINVFLPALGPFILGLLSSSCAMLPTSVIESVFRRINRGYNVILEDVKWYKDAEDGRIGWLRRPRLYRQYKLKPKHKKMNFSLMFQDGITGRRKFRNLNQILRNRGLFWNWLEPTIPVPEDPEKPTEMLPNIIESQNLLDDADEKEDEQDEDYDEDGDLPWWEKVINAAKRFFVEEDEPKPEQEEQPTSIASSLAEPEITAVDETVVEAAANDALTAEGVQDEAEEEKPKPKRVPLVNVGANFVVQPISLWEVDSDFSIDSMDLRAADLRNFTAVESMPAGEFKNFRKSKKEAAVINVHKLAEEGGVWHDHPMQLEIELDAVVSEIDIPLKIQELDENEGVLVSWIFYDYCVHGNKWLKKGVPLAAVLMADQGTASEVDWWGVDVDSQGEYDADVGKYAAAMRDGTDQSKYELAQKLRTKFPNPVPEERIFSMLMFPGYVEKLSAAFDEMVNDPAAWSALAAFYTELSETKDGAIVFCEACIKIAVLENGGKIVHDIFSCSQSSSLWTTLIIEMTQRLRYQGDNVARLKEKYGLDNSCLRNAFDRSPYMETYANENESQASRKQGDLDCVYTELEKLASWRRKLSDLVITGKVCPLDGLRHDEVQRISQFYRSMLLTPGGCTLFGELVRQVAVTNDGGRQMVASLVRFISAQKDGVPCLNQLLKGLAKTDLGGRRLLTKLFNVVDSRLPYGPQVLSNLAHSLSQVDMGSVLLREMQLDAAKAHKAAHEVRQTIRRNLEPRIKVCRRNVCRLITSFNRVAERMLGVTESVRMILDNEPDELEETPPDRYEGNTLSEQQRHAFQSERYCCRNAEDGAQKARVHGNTSPSNVVPVPAKPTRSKKEPEYFELSCDTSSTTSNDEQRLVSDLWKPLDDRGDTINIYKSSRPKMKKGKSRGEKCQRQKRDDLNKFFLQSKDYEKFNMDFLYRPRGRVRIPFTSDLTGDFNRCWSPTEQPVVSFVDETGAIKSSCVKWRRDFKEDPKNWGGVPLCMCRNRERRGRGEKDISCFICDIAGMMGKARNSDEAIDILVDECHNIVAKDEDDLETVPPLGEVTKNAELLVGRGMAPIPSQGPSGIMNVDENQDDMKKKVIERMSDDSPDASLQEQDKDAFLPPAKDESTHSDRAPISSHGRDNSNCECSGVGHRKNYLETARNLAIYSPAMETTGTVVNPKSETTADDDCCSHRNDKIARVEHHHPKIAPRRRKKANKVTISTDAPEVAYRTIQPPLGRDCVSPATQRKTPQSKKQSDKNKVDYWADDDLDSHIISFPEVPDKVKFCKECGGLVMLGNMHGTENRSIASKAGKRQGDADSLDSGSSDSVDQADPQYGTYWKDAIGCCGTPGCHAVLPRGADYRAITKGNNENEEFIRIQTPRQEIHEQWKKDSPFDRDFLIKNRHGDKEDMSLVPPASGETRNPNSTHGVAKGEASMAQRKWPPVTKKKQQPEPPKNDYGQMKRIPLTAKVIAPQETRQESTYSRKRKPRFECCEISAIREKGISGPPEQCLHRDKKLDPYAETFFQAQASPTKSHSVCSNCRIRIGTEQRPPCVQHLLPLKVVRCFETAMLRQGKFIVKPDDSGTSLETALDMMHEDDMVPPNENTLLSLHILLGLANKQGVSPEAKPQQSRQSNCSLCPTPSSSELCCHLHKENLLPILHLQGFTCQTRDQYSSEISLPPLSSAWWKKHSHALLAMQECADACECLSLVLSVDTTRATEHQKSCKICSTFGGIGQKPQFVPAVWIRETPSNVEEGESAPERPRFYEKVVERVVESTKMMLFTPDLEQPGSKASHQSVLYDADITMESGGKDDTNIADSPVVPATHTKRLVNFRALMNCLNDIQNEESQIRKDNLLNARDISNAAMLQRQAVGELMTDGHGEKEAVHLINLLTNFIKKKACGSVLDCRDVLEAPWELPTEQQHIAGRMLKNIDSAISTGSSGSFEPIDKSDTWKNSLSCVVDAYFQEVTFRASAQSDIIKAIKKASTIKCYLEKLGCYTREWKLELKLLPQGQMRPGLSLARLLQFTVLTQSASRSLKDSIKAQLVSFDSTNPISKYPGGPDTPQASLDDIFITFERLRQGVRSDMSTAAMQVKALIDLLDEDALWLFGAAATRPVKDIGETISANMDMSRGDKPCRISGADTFPRHEATAKNTDLSLESSTKLARSNPFPSARGTLLSQTSLERVGQQDDDGNWQPTAPHKYHSVFKVPLELDSKKPVDTEMHTRKALQATKGKGMLETIFGTDMTQIEMVEAFHANISTLLEWRSGCLPDCFGSLLRILVLALAVCCGAGTVLFTFYFYPAGDVVLSAIPFALIGHCLALEPLKCIIVSWILYLLRRTPGFHNSPIYMKSNLSLLEKAELSQPRFTEVTDAGDEYYRTFCQSRASGRFFDRRRRILPIITADGMGADDRGVSQEPEQPPSDSLPDATADDEDENLDNFFPFDEIDLPDDGQNRDKDEEEKSLIDFPDSDSSQRGDSEESKETRPKKTEIIYCRYSNMPK